MADDNEGYVVPAEVGPAWHMEPGPPAVFKLLSDETRLRILIYLALSEEGELHVTELCQRQFPIQQTVEAIRPSVVLSCVLHARPGGGLVRTWPVNVMAGPSLPASTSASCP